MSLESKNQIHVLIVEDDEVYAQLLELKLSKSTEFGCFQVTHASSLTDFKEKISQTKKPDVILSDLGFPGSQGLQTFHAISSLAGDIPVVILTGTADRKTEMTAVGLGAQDYLIKASATSDHIAQSILHAIERNRLQLELKRANEKLKLLAVTDPLTGLLNRRGMEQTLQRELAMKKRYGFDFFMALIDLDDFKSVNERYGHSTGDLVLERTAACIKRSIRSTDYAARIGGDEFLVLLVRTRKENILKIVGRIREAICARTFSTPEEGLFNTTASAGLIELGDEDSQLDQIIKKTDPLLRQSKQTGKNRVSFPDS